MSDVAKRIQVTLPTPIHEKLERWANHRDQALATVAAIAIERAILDAETRGEIPATESETKQ